MPEERSKVLLSFFLSYDPATEEFLELDEQTVRIAHRIASDEELELSPGGQVVLSTDVNVDKSVLGRIKGWAKSALNRLFRSRKVDEAILDILKQKGLSTGWSIGNLFKGRYYDRETDTLYNEKSFTIDIRGMEMSVVRDIAKALGKKFDQKEVLVVDNSTGQARLIKTGA